jgi:type III pantothenate kinase
MAQALHAHTALLPPVEVASPPPAVPATSTSAAMQAGIFWAVAGGVEALRRELARVSPRPAEVFLTGGDGPLLAPVLGPDIQHWPFMTLEGVRVVAEAAP